MRPKIITILLLFFTLVLCACKPKDVPVWQAASASVILISLDTVRADHLSCYGYHRNTTPGIDRIAGECVFFSGASTPISHTMPAHTSLFTSRYPREHKALYNGWKYREKFPLLAESMKAAGFNTGAIVASGILKSRRGLNKGFNFYEDEFEASRFRESRQEGKKFRKTADEVVDRAIEWLKGQDHKVPVFLFLHFFDAHDEYDFTPEKYKLMFPTDPELVSIMQRRGQDSMYIDLINQYDGSIRFIDDELLRLWESLKQADIYDNALIIITSDHGEGLGEHDWYKHGLYVYEEQMHVPLIIRFPKSEHAGKSIDAMVNLVDIAPTILDFCGLPPLPDLRGYSLLPVVKGGKDRVRKYQFYERRWYPEENQKRIQNWAPGEKRGIRDERWKYIFASMDDDELFDLEKDPHELDNIISRHPEMAGALREQLDKYVGMVEIGELRPQRLDRESRKELEALGYLR